MARRMTVYETRFMLGGKVNSSLGRAFAKVQGKMKGLDRSAKSTRKSYYSLSRTIQRTIMAAGVYMGMHGIVNGLQSASNAAIDFNDQMADIGTLLDGDVSKKLANASKQTKKLAIQTGLSTTTLNQGYYQVISALGDTKDAYAIFEKASKDSVAGNVSVTDSVNFLSAVMKGYGKINAETAQKVSDLGFEAVKLGQTTFPELAANIGQVIPFASTLGVKMESLFGAEATLTGVTGDTAEVSTQLKAILMGLVKPTTQMQKTIHGLGYSSGMAMIKANGLQGTLNILNKVTGGSSEKMGQLFGRARALTAVFALTGAQADAFTQKTKAMYNTLGISDKDFKLKSKQTKNLMARFKQLGNVLMINLGDKILPYINKELTYVLNNFDHIAASAKRDIKPIIGLYTFIKNNWGKLAPIIVGLTAAYTANKIALLGLIAAQKAGMIITGLTAAWGTAVTYVQLLAEGESLLEVAQLALNVAMTANPIGLIITGVGLLAAGAYVLYKNWDKISKWWGGMWKGMKKEFNGFVLNAKMDIVKLMKFIPSFLLPNGVKQWKKKVLIEYEQKHSGNIVLNTKKKAKTPLGDLQNLKNAPISNLSNYKNAKIPAFAKGIRNFIGGMAIVGEKGPELVDMPPGSSVTPASRTEKLLQSLNSITNNNQSIVFHYSPQTTIQGNANEVDIERALEKHKEEVKQMLLEITGNPRTSFSM